MQDYTFNYLQYRKKINKPARFIFPILIILIVFFTATLSFLNYTTNTIKYHFVSINSFINYKNANNLANDIQLKGAAGYVYQEDNYIVLAGYYPTMENATTVCNNLKEEFSTCSVYTVEIERFYNKKYLTKIQNKTLEDYFNNLEDTISSLYNLSLGLDKSEISINLLEVKLKTLTDEFSKQHTNFCNVFKNNKYVQIKKLSLNTQESLLNILNSNNLSQQIKYQIIHIIFNYKSMLSYFWFLFSFSISTICQMPTPIKNSAKSFLSKTLEMLFAKSAPHKLNMQPTKANPQVCLNATKWFFMWIIKAITAIGKNATKLTPCAANCWYDKNIVKIGIVNVPPPIPIPPTTPPKIPAKISQNIIHTYQNSITVPLNNIKNIKIPLIVLLLSLFNAKAPITPPAIIPTITGQPLAKSIEWKHI